MPYCPKCGTLVAEDTTICSNCGYALQPQKPAAPPLLQLTSPPSPTLYPPSIDVARRYAIFGLASAILSLLILPEIFGSTAIILGAYSWKNEVGNSKRGLYISILGIVCMLVGIYFTALI